MKFIIITLIASVFSLAPVAITRPNDQKVMVEGIGCYGLEGPIQDIKVASNQDVKVFNEYGCKGNPTYTGASKRFGAPINAKSIMVSTH